MRDMEDIIVRSRYPRHSAQGRRRKRNTRDESSLAEIILRQVAISVLILLILVIIKAANTPVTDYLSGKIAGAVLYDIDMKAIYGGIDDVFGRLTDREKPPEEADNETDLGEYDPVMDHTAGEEASLPEGEAVAGESTEVAGEAEQTPSATANREETGSRGATPAAAVKSAFIIPVGGKIGSPYGYRDDPFTGARKFHAGIDIEANKGASIKAAMDGEVIAAGSEATLGNYVKLQHKGGYATLYAHCSVLQVKAGQKVKQGAVIAKVGDTGRSIGAHLHFEIWKDQKTVDPMKYVAATTAQKG